MTRVSRFLWAVSLLASSSLFAAPTEVKILIDKDNNPATGCRVITPTGIFDGAEQILTMTYDSSVAAVKPTSLSLTVTSETCSGGFLTRPELVPAAANIDRV